jgi:hypothetical protein
MVSDDEIASVLKGSARIAQAYSLALVKALNKWMEKAKDSHGLIK